MYAWEIKTAACSVLMLLVRGTPYSKQSSKLAQLTGTLWQGAPLPQLRAAAHSLSAAAHSLSAAAHSLSAAQQNTPE